MVLGPKSGRYSSVLSNQTYLKISGWDDMDSCLPKEMVWECESKRGCEVDLFWSGVIA